MLSTRLRDKRISSLFVLRFFCVFMIVAIHYPMAHAEWLEPLLRTAVPLFFMTSGYFLFSENRRSVQKRIQRSLSKMIWIILYANIIYGCLKIIAYKAGIGDALILDSATGWIKLLLVGNVIIEYLWYLTAYTEALLIFLLFFRVRWEGFLIRIAPLLLLMCLLLGKYSFLLGLDNATPLYISRNFLTIALPCICLGYLLHHYEDTLSTWFNSNLRRYIVILILVALFEGFLLRGVWRMGDLFLTSVPLAVMIFLLCLRNKSFGGNTPFDRMGEMHALNIYLFQALIAGMLAGLGQHLFGVDITPYAAPLIFLGCLLFSEVINQMDRTLRR